MSQIFKVLFFLKKGKRTNEKLLPVYVRITTSGQRVEWSVQRSCDPCKWNQRADRSTGTKEDSKTLNAYLDAVQGQILEIQKEYALRNEIVTADQIRTAILHGNYYEKRHKLLEVFQYHNDQFEKLVGTEFSKRNL